MGCFGGECTPDAPPPIKELPDGGYGTGKPAPGEVFAPNAESKPSDWKTGAGYHAEAFKSKLAEWAKGSGGIGLPGLSTKFGGKGKGSKRRGGMGGGGSSGPATVGGGSGGFGLPNPYADVAHLGNLIPKLQTAPIMKPSIDTMTF